MALTLSIKNRTWKKAIRIMLILSVILLLAGIFMKANNHPDAGLLLIVGPLPVLITLFMRWVFGLAGKPA
jgi:hypothetical protein